MARYLSGDSNVTDQRWQHANIALLDTDRSLNTTTMVEHANGQPKNFKIYRKYHDRLRRADGWYCFVVYRPYGRSVCTVLQDKLVRASSLPLLRWHGGGDHRGTQQAKIAIGDAF